MEPVSSLLRCGAYVVVSCTEHSTERGNREHRGAAWQTPSLSDPGQHQQWDSVMLVRALDMTWGEWHFTSLVILSWTGAPNRTMREIPENANGGTVYLTSVLLTVQLIKNKNDLGNFTVKRSPERHDDEIQCGVLGESWTWRETLRKL